MRRRRVFVEFLKAALGILILILFIPATYFSFLVGNRVADFLHGKVQKNTPAIERLVRFGIIILVALITLHWAIGQLVGMMPK